MKKMHASLAIGMFAILTWSCNNSGTTSGTNDSTSSTTTTTTTGADTGNRTGDTSSRTGMGTSTSGSSARLSKDDSEFVMKAAIGGMQEVEGGKIAQQNASNQRVKDFGSMMVTDHSKANDQLKSLVSSKGMNLPDSLPASKRKDLNSMQKMTGKSFDQHYVNMMVDDHKKDVAEFKRQASSAKDPDLKTWIAQTLPVLQKHLDSIEGIKKSMK